MFGGVFMAESVHTTIDYPVGEHVISLDKDMVERYSEVVCPVDGEYVTRYVRVLNPKRNKNDQVLSLEIALDMAKELSEYEA